MSKWIDCDAYDMSVGHIGYLVETLNTNTGRTLWCLHERPLRTNRSHEATLYGWCGETNNLNRNARGAWRVVRINKARDRIQIVKLSGGALAAHLEADGYPELVD